MALLLLETRRGHSCVSTGGGSLMWRSSLAACSVSCRICPSVVVLVVFLDGQYFSITRSPLSRAKRPNRFANMTAVAGLMSWFGISITYIRFYSGLKAQGIDRTALPYHSRLQPFAGWYAMFSTIIICFVCNLCLSSPYQLSENYLSSADGTSS